MIPLLHDTDFVNITIRWVNAVDDKSVIINQNINLEYIMFFSDETVNKIKLLYGYDAHNVLAEYYLKGSDSDQLNLINDIPQRYIHIITEPFITMNVTLPMSMWDGILEIINVPDEISNMVSVASKNKNSENRVEQWHDERLKNLLING